MTLDKFFKPKSIAVIGASRDPNKIGHVILKNILDAGYKGKIYPINPKAEEILNLKSYKSVLDIREEIDLAIIAVPAEFAIKVLEQCGKKEIEAVSMISAGFSEIGNEDADEEIKEILKRYGIRMIGPNILGILDAHTNLDTIFIPRLRLTRPHAGGISFICQSGAVGSATMDLVATQGYGFSKFISYGNALDLNECDFLEYLGKDPKTKVICLYLEGVKDGKRFLEVAKRVSKKKPIIAIKGGITEEGSEAVLSHTASLAGSFEIYKGLFKQTNIIHAKNLEELFTFARILDKSMKPKGNKIQIITNGGGYGILATDSVSENNLKLAVMSTETRKKIKRNTSTISTIKNPIDLAGDVTTKTYDVVIRECLYDKNIDIILLIVLMQTPLIGSDIVGVISELNAQQKKPIIVVTTGGDFTELHKRNLELRGIPCFTYPDSAVKAIKAMCDYYLH
ncbi:MAG: CoA-binding protein [Candidatus Nanoarchaeia archaeon]|nr:CoA-binding protein [Candidatus Nanoarchaeia archaeon]